MANNPTKQWATFLVDHGGYSTLLSIPAMVATVVFIGRLRSLKQKQPHPYGRTGWIYWPTQILMSCAILSVLALAYSLVSGPYLAEADGLLMSCFFLVIAWVIFCVLLFDVCLLAMIKIENKSKRTLLLGGGV